MRHPRSIFTLLAGGAILAPSLVFGHACELLVAKLETAAGLIKLEITADYGDNPLLGDEVGAREAARSVLRVRFADGRLLPLEDLAPLEWEPRRQWDPDMPESVTGRVSADHRLLVAKWQWQTRPPGQGVQFVVPDGSLFDALLWMPGARGDPSAAKWLMLIEGDASPVITASGPASATHAWAWAAGGILAIIGLWRVRFRVCCRTTRCAAAG